MTPHDFDTLLRWLYQDERRAALPLAHADTRVNERNLRAMASGRSTIAPAIARYLEGRAALRLTLKGWRDELPELEADTRAAILTRLQELEHDDPNPPTAAT